MKSTNLWSSLRTRRNLERETQQIRATSDCTVPDYSTQTDATGCFSSGGSSAHHCQRRWVSTLHDPHQTLWSWDVFRGAGGVQPRFEGHLDLIFRQRGGLCRGGPTFLFCLYDNIRKDNCLITLGCVDIWFQSNTLFKWQRPKQWTREKCHGLNVTIKKCKLP